MTVKPKKSKPRFIEFVRAGNPWLVGKNVNRIVPVYLIQNLLATDLVRDKKDLELQQAIKDLAYDVTKAANAGLKDRIPDDSAGREFLTNTARGLLAPERRIFRDLKRGGAGKSGSFFPLVGGLVAPTPSDDGLGRRLRELMESWDSDWRKRLAQLLLPDTAKDPATAFATILLGGKSGRANSESASSASRKRLDEFDRASAQFVDNLISPQTDARRISAIRNLAIGSYLISILKIVTGSYVGKNKSLPYVFVYGGLPPGESDNPIVRAACQSFQSWISRSWLTTAETIFERMEAKKGLPKSTFSEKRAQQLQQLLTMQMQGPGLDDTVDGLRHFCKLKTTGVPWVRHVMVSKTVGFSRTEFTRRVRSLGANIGFVGPDRGFGNPRLFFDTPLLGVLTKGVIGPRKLLDFRTFVTELAEKFGLVLGLGEDESVANQVDIIGSGGLDPDEVLSQNQEIFRERLVRVGLARTYSDSHTEVVADV